MSTLKITVLRNGVEVPLEESEKTGEKLKAEILSSNVAYSGNFTSPLAELARKQASEAAKMLTSQPGIMIPKYDWEVISVGISQQAVFATALLQGNDNILKGVADQVGGLISAVDRMHKDYLYATDSFQKAILSINDALYVPHTLRQWEEISKRYKKALQILEVNPNAPDEYYRHAPLDALEQEAAVVLWMKEREKQGRLHHLREIKQLLKFASSGQISDYTLDKFSYLLPETLYALTVDDRETAELLEGMIGRGDLTKQRLLDLRDGRIATINDTSRMLAEHLSRLFPTGVLLQPGKAQTLEELIAALPGEPDSGLWWQALNDAYNNPDVLYRINFTQQRVIDITGIPERTVKRKLKKRN